MIERSQNLFVSHTYKIRLRVSIWLRGLKICLFHKIRLRGLNMNERSQNLFVSHTHKIRLRVSIWLRGLKICLFHKIRLRCLNKIERSQNLFVSHTHKIRLRCPNIIEKSQNLLNIILHIKSCWILTSLIYTYENKPIIYFHTLLFCNVTNHLLFMCGY